MCTAISFHSSPFLFGRNLDLDRRYDESIVCLGRRFAFPYRYSTAREGGFAIFGTATVNCGIPMFYDAVNEAGLYMAGLNFPKSAGYGTLSDEKSNLLIHELIPFVLSRCRSVNEALGVLGKIRIVDEAFSPQYPVAKLHFFVADKNQSVAAEPMAGKMFLAENPYGVLTNDPPLPEHLKNIEKAAAGLKRGELLRYPEISASPTSESRFIRAAVCSKMAEKGATEAMAINQLFHVLSHVAVTEGTADVSPYHKTVYTSVCSPKSHSYYYSTYENPGIKSVTFSEDNFRSNRMFSVPMIFN